MWFVLGVFLFGLYKKPIYDYYLVFMFPLPFFLIGNLIGKVSEFMKGTMRYGVVLGGFYLSEYLAIISITSHFNMLPNKQKAQTEEIAKFVISQTDNKPFNFALFPRGEVIQIMHMYII